jgi:aryl-alcohol dehydrogenase-like predicted oxidoreductase
MKSAYKVGINYFHCAKDYCGGESKKVMGLAIRKFGWKRSDTVISTQLHRGGPNGDSPVNNMDFRIFEGIKVSLEHLQPS